MTSTDNETLPARLRLRAWEFDPDLQLLREAANEIERLRKIASDLARWVQGNWMYPSEHQCSEVGNAFGGYDCECGAPWLTDGCPAAAALAAYQALPSTEGPDQ